jgi:hypothetical protein
MIGVSNMLKINQLYFIIDGYKNQLFCEILIGFFELGILVTMHYH